MIRKSFQLFLALIVTVLLLEGMARISYERELRKFPPMPEEIDQFQNFNHYLQYLKKLGFLEERLAGQPADYSAYTASSLKPNYHLQLKNIELSVNRWGMRAENFSVPKPKGVFRVFLLGGSTVEGGLNQQWTISHYLAERLKATNPNVEVINAGVVGYFSMNELLLLKTKILDLQPDLVIILDGRNDLYYPISGALPNQADSFHALQAFLDNFINRPRFFPAISYQGKLLEKKSYFLTDLFRKLFRRGYPQIYPRHCSITRPMMDEYLQNLTLMKAILEINNVCGMIIFQPTLGYGKERLTPYEKSIEDYVQTEEKSDWLSAVKTAWPEIGKAVGGLGNSRLVKFYDFSNLFRNFQGTAYCDSCHYTPASCRKIASETAKFAIKDFLSPTVSR